MYYQTYRLFLFCFVRVAIIQYKIAYVGCIVFPLDSIPLKLGGEHRSLDFDAIDANLQQGGQYWLDQGEARGKEGHGSGGAGSRHAPVGAGGAHD